MQKEAILYLQLFLYLRRVKYILVVGVCTLINVFLGQVDLVGCLHPEKLDCTQKSTL